MVCLFVLLSDTRGSGATGWTLGVRMQPFFLLPSDTRSSGATMRFCSFVGHSEFGCDNFCYFLLFFSSSVGHSEFGCDSLHNWGSVSIIKRENHRKGEVG